MSQYRGGTALFTAVFILCILIFFMMLNQSGLTPTGGRRPTSFINDKKGVIRHIHNGFAKDDMAGVENIVNQLLAEK